MVTSHKTKRVLGVATTSHGVAFAVVEGTVRLVDWGRRDGRAMSRLGDALAKVLARWKPSAVAYETSRPAHKTLRGVAVLKVLAEMCRTSGGCLVRVDHTTRSLKTHSAIAEEVVRYFPALKRALPRRRRLWDGANDRIGLFLATFAALCAVRQMTREEPERNSVYDDS